ncbi:MAG: bifunctional phosphopantothenoylcysteine decarboxylase/phosphopantothenate--cysteine ligase CoaBC [Proteobacteria bacterium]|nr:bifunctional phosphopantothenoylcysteine decarboxylase/phosphopantothenate--cysteine ligase CoaBC [Pseudomonadota bacterium]MDA0845605.1 bifunctional phosphopantothenoylcysteine decarboxylase/phosphopantothenate--cysteine ligase CoaBC [Pseudomonadota bacterium]
MILLIIGGGIAAYKALETARQMQRLGLDVTGVMTKSAGQFITPLSVAALTNQKCYDDLFSLTDEAEMGHIRLARSADLVLVMPATANLMARAASGLADDLATTILLATTAPILMAPAMNPAMWAHPATVANLEVLRQRGVHMIGPTEGDTACGEIGSGRMSEPADIAAAAFELAVKRPQTLAGKTAIVTAGPTVEPIDSVRFIANHSSGKQGYAIAALLAARGASVTLISGPVTLPAPAGVKRVSVQTAAQMQAAVNAALPADIAICAAAVADWRVAEARHAKLKKPDHQNAAGMQLTLIENPDILASLGQSDQRPKLLIGFAAETEDVLENATAKRSRKQCDWMIANQVGAADDPVFGSDQNHIMLISETAVETWPRMLKTELADKLAERITMEFLT